MVDTLMRDGVRERTPDLNPRIVKGIAYEQMQTVEQFIDHIFRAAAADFPEGLTYDGYRRCTPKEEFEEATRARDNRQTLEMARSDFYLLAYQFSYNGVKLFPKYIYLPYVDVGGMLYVRGKRFAISPVLADPAYSLGSSNMFIQLTRARLTFERTTHRIMVDGEQDMAYVVWSWAHGMAKQRHGRKAGASTVVYSTLANYLFAKYGFIEAMRNFTGAEVIVGGDDINLYNYPREEFVICSSTGIKPRSNKESNYRHTRIRVAIPRAQYTPLVRSLIAGFYYVVDNYPSRIKPEYLLEGDTWVWKTLLGHIIYGAGTSEGLMVNDVEEHLISLDEYIDFMVKGDLKKAGLAVEDIYEFFIFVIETLGEKTVSTDDSISNMFGKRLITQRYVMFDVVSQINTLLYKLRAAKKKRNKLEESEINNLMNKYLRSNRIAGISNHEKHPEVTPVSTASDNLYIGVTATMLTQDSASGGGSKKGKINLRDPAKHLHSSMAIVAGYNNMRKSDPTGRSTPNPCMELEPDGTVKEREDSKELLAQVQYLLTT